MNLPQILSLAVLGGMMLLFIWGRIRYDMVAVLALLVSLLVGIVKPKHAFSGFSDDIVIIVGRVRLEMIGHPFKMFDFFPVGFGLAVTGLLFLRFGYKLLPSGRHQHG